MPALLLWEIPQILLLHPYLNRLFSHLLKAQTWDPLSLILDQGGTIHWSERGEHKASLQDALRTATLHSWHCSGDKQEGAG